ncbi:hypothetical protein [Nonlabens ponticola]|uniref:Uncharacterized protein n=1 Tax=Nonlabens ponticola TaxID=2496866 RepID=A0A3S9MXR7_9FLAO|nr:hypothetical protein [Nonlabens ponticola]AZQ44055.1 hypothetical protein EJ995_07345 [Nonlabens ponticola]
MDKTKSTYTLLLSLVFIGIGSWKLYEFYYTADKPETYQAVLAGFLILLGVFQLYRGVTARRNK